MRSRMLVRTKVKRKEQHWVGTEEVCVLKSGLGRVNQGRKGVCSERFQLMRFREGGSTKRGRKTLHWEKPKTEEVKISSRGIRKDKTRRGNKQMKLRKGVVFTVRKRRIKTK